MTNKDQIKDLFSNGLQDHQVSVDPALWSSISASLGTGAAKTGLSILSKTLIGVAASSIAVVSIYLAVQASTSAKTDKKPVQQITPATKNNRTYDNNVTPAITLPSAPTPDNTQDQSVNQLLDSGQPTANTASAQTLIPESVIEQIQEIIPTIRQDFQVSGYPKPSAQISQATITNSNPQSATTTSIQPVQHKQRIFLPNIFTPNGDLQNDYLQIDWQQAEVLDFSIVVLDSKNNIVYRNDNPHFQWDGTDLGGEKTVRGSYIYFVTASLNGQKWQQSSSLQIQY